MRLTFKTDARKRFDYINKHGYWHKKFIIFPRVLKRKSGSTELIFFETVYRKATWCILHNHDTYSCRLGLDRWLYKTRESIVFEKLAEGDELRFDNPEAEQMYSDIKCKLAEED
jgi:hypothetical protein